jgi:signal transduction histidine kinase
VRTTAAATAIVAVALALGGVVLVALLRASLVDDVQTAAQLRAGEVVALLDSGRPLGELAVDHAEESAVQVLDRGGAVLAASANMAGRPPMADLAPGAAVDVAELPIGDDNGYRVVAAGTRDGGFLVLVARTLDPAFESSAAVTDILLAGIPILIVLVGATTWAVTGRALRPVEDLRREVATISGSALARRVPQPAGDDEIARLARTMNAMLDRLQAARDRQARFVADASHELRNPIASIRHQLETALARPDRGAQAELMSGLLAEDLRMERLVTDLLVLARADEHTLTRHRRPVDLDDIVLAEAGRLRASGAVRVDATTVSAGRVDGDPTQLRCLVRNLVDNAERHARSTVRLGLRVEAGLLRLTVADDGAGIAEADRERIFERFTRLDDARDRDRGGAGLGLAIVAEVVRAHAGSVHVEPGRGARFVVVLPSTEDGDDSAWVKHPVGRVRRRSPFPHERNPDGNALQ